LAATWWRRTALEMKATIAMAVRTVLRIVSS
jgi:hypothetical protein